jgi:hypothetical protein
MSISLPGKILFRRSHIRDVAVNEYCGVRLGWGWEGKGRAGPSAQGPDHL